MRNFKVGDWVRIKTGTFEYDGTASISKGVKRLSKSDMWLFNENHYKCAPDKYIEHWKPKPGEWCWFYNRGDAFPVLRQFVKMSEENLYLANNIVCDWAYEYCEPFIGGLPTLLKDNK